MKRSLRGVATAVALIAGAASFVTETRAAREGRFVEVVGHYNPRTKPETVEVDRDRLAHWLKAGAQPSDTVRTLIDRLPAAPPAEVVAAS